MNRRQVLQSAIAATPLLPLLANAEDAAKKAPKVPDVPYKIKNNRIKQSVMGWCFKPMPPDELIRACAAMGMHGIEGVGRDNYPLIQELGMAVSLVGTHGFAKGPVDRANHEMVKEKLLDAINVAVDVGSKSVITFTGMNVEGQDRETSEANCIDCWKAVLPVAEEKGINIVLEHLNSRDDSHPMKGHPGYFGDDVDHCVELIRRTESPNMKLLFDVYHVSVMNGDIIRRIRQYEDVIGHIHTAGNPGRSEIDETQEIYYPAVMQALLDIGYDGFVAQEFLPTWDDKIKSLAHGVEVCDI